MINTIKFSQMIDGGDINNNDKTPGLNSGNNVIFNNPWTFLPPGSTAQRPAPSVVINYRLRFNTDEQLYEYYDAILGQWTQLQESLFVQGPFLIYTADSSIPDGQNLGALANGILKQTISIGVSTLDIAVNGTDFYGPGFIIPGVSGGTGINNNSLTIDLSSGSSGYVMTSDSSGNAVWMLNKYLTDSVLLTPSGAQSIAGFDLTVNGVTIGQGAFSSVTNTAIGANVLGSNASGTLNTGTGQNALTAITSGNQNSACGANALSSITTASNNVGVGCAVGTNAGFGANVTTGDCNTFLGNNASANNAAAVGTIAIGCSSVSDIATGVTSSDNGPGIAIGSNAMPVGFRGDQSLYPTAGVGSGTLPLTFTGYWRIKINDIYYKIPLYLDS